MSVRSRCPRWVVGLAAAALAVPLAASTATAARANGFIFSVKAPAAGSISWLYVRLQGTLKPGAMLPAKLDLSQLAEVEKLAPLPKGLAVYAAARVGRSGSTIAIRELILVLNPRSTGKRKLAIADREGSPPTVKLFEPFSGAGGLSELGAAMQEAVEHHEWNMQVSAELQRTLKGFEADGEPSTDAPSKLESPDPVIGSTPPLVAGLTPADLGSWEGGHAFGWRVNGSSPKAAAVFNDVDQITGEIRRLLNPTGEEKAFIEASLASETARLDEAANLPRGALDLIPSVSATAPAAGTATTPTPGSSQPVVVVAANSDTFSGSPCLPGGGLLELSWTIRGGQPGEKLVIAASGPGLHAEKTLTLDASGKASVEYKISGSGDWTTRIVSIGGAAPPAKNSTDHADATCG